MFPRQLDHLGEEFFINWPAEIRHMYSMVQENLQWKSSQYCRMSHGFITLENFRNMYMNFRRLHVIQILVVKILILYNYKPLHVVYVLEILPIEQTCSVNWKSSNTFHDISLSH